jgi:hypothetical protein
MKKFVIATVLLTSIVVVALFVKRNENEQNTHKEKFPDESLQAETLQALDQAQEALGGAKKAIEAMPVSKPTASATIATDNSPASEEEGMVLTEEQMIKLESYFEKVEKDWSDRMNQLLTRELGLEPKVVEEYWKMREGYEQDKLDAFEDFHEEMIEKYGENYTYRPSDEEQMFSAKVRERYDQALMKLIGADAYARYLEARDQYNRELSEVEDKDLGFIKVDF